MRHVFRVLALLALAGCAPAAHEVKPTLAAGDAGTIWFLGEKDLVIPGELRFPDAPGRVPGIVLLHGCSGLPHLAIGGWEPLLRRWSYATLIVDSFGPRGYREVCTNGRVGPLPRVADAYAALAILRTHPRIDPERILLMGFSHGGLVTVIASTDWARRFARAPEQRFRAAIAFYPYCATRVEQRPRMVIPLRVHHGAADDWAPAAPCVESMERYRADGGDVQITVYPDAPHGFDAVGSTITYLPNVLNVAQCRTTIRSLDDARGTRDLGDCVRRGGTSGYHGPATEQARVNVRAQLAELLR